MEIKRNIEHKPKTAYTSLFATLGSLVLFFILAFIINKYDGLSIDKKLVVFAEENITGNTYHMIAFFTNLGSERVVIPVAVLSLLILWWKTRDYIGMVTIAIVLAGSNELFQILKGVFLRERPILDPSIDATGYSFPSGHSTVSMALYGIILYFILKYMQKSLMKNVIVVFLSGYILFMGLSRVLLKAHYLSDVLAGFAIGFVYLMACIFIYEKVMERRVAIKKKKSELTV
ncbi:phosphatase PAP2 family protein [Bacillus sp. AK128]